MFYSVAEPRMNNRHITLNLLVKYNKNYRCRFGLLDFEDDGSVTFRNVCNYLAVNTA
jgi:hypothetical protein